MTKLWRWGVSLRPQYFLDLKDRAIIQPLEILVDNLFGHRGGPFLWYTRELCARSPQVTLHSVGLNVAGFEPLDTAYLQELKHFASLLQPEIVSDHLSFSSCHGLYSYELLPTPRTYDNGRRIARRISQIQDVLERELTVENPSAYIEYEKEEMDEAAFLQFVCEEANCGILLDANNWVVNSFNFSKPLSLDALDANRIRCFHISGHSEQDGYFFDSHDCKAKDEVFAVVNHLLQKRDESWAKPVTLFIERDDAEARYTDIEQQITVGQEVLTSLHTSKASSFPSAETSFFSCDKQSHLKHAPDLKS